MALHWIDILVLITYFLGTVWLGLHITGKNKTTDDYFLGGRSMPGWAVGISLIGSMISSVTFLAYPADAFKTAWVRYIPNFAFPLVVLISAKALIPFFRRGTVTSAYQYLSLRFGSSISAYAAMLFLLVQIFRSATIIYLVAMLLAPMIGLRVEWCILLAGGATALYAVKGGFGAVLWVEVAQTLVLLLGGFVSIGAVIWAMPGGLSQILAEAGAAGKLSFMDLKTATGALEPISGGFSLTEKTVSMLVFVGIIQHFTGKFDQTTVQRWCSARTAKEANKSMWVLGIGSLPIWGAFMFLGTCLWVYFRHHPNAIAEGVLAGTHKAEEIMPYFIVSVLPPGISGLVIAAAMAAAMSTLSGCISAVGMVAVNDLYRTFFVKDQTDKHYLRAGLVFSLLASLLMVAGAFAFYHTDAKTFTDLGLVIGALLGGGIASTFFLGMFTRVGDARCILTGIAFTLAFTLWAMLMQFGVIETRFDLYYTALIGNLIMFVTAYVAGFILKAGPRDLTNLTVWDSSREPLV